MGQDVTRRHRPPQRQHNEQLDPIATRRLSLRVMQASDQAVLYFGGIVKSKASLCGRGFTHGAGCNYVASMLAKMQILVQVVASIFMAKKLS